MLGRSPGQIQFAAPSIEPEWFAVLLHAPNDQQLSRNSEITLPQSDAKCEKPNARHWNIGHRGTMDQNNAPMLATQVPTKIRNWRNNETLYRGWCPGCPGARAPSTRLTLPMTRCYPFWLTLKQNESRKSTWAGAVAVANFRKSLKAYELWSIDQNYAKIIHVNYSVRNPRGTCVFSLAKALSWRYARCGRSAPVWWREWAWHFDAAGLPCTAWHRSFRWHFGTGGW